MTRGLELEGKRAVVTGSSAGIGAGIARLFTQQGAKVFVHGRDSARTEKIAHELGADGWMTADLKKENDANAFIEAINKAFGGVDILVNNAGGEISTSKTGSSFDVPPEAWVSTYNANWISALRLIQAFVPGMRERRWGRIIQIASGSGYSAQPGVADYGSAKAGMINATISLARDLKHTGVTSNVISPGVIVTAKSKEWLMGLAAQHGWGHEWADVEKKAAMTTMPNLAGRLGRPEDIARAALFLASPAADFVTGSEMRIDGGRLS